MSFKQYKQAHTRLQRSFLSVPGSNPSLFEKPANSDVDYIYLEFEDTVVPDDEK